MREECKAWFRKKVLEATEGLLEDLDKHPTYLEDGEDTTLSLRVFFSLDQPWKVWNERPDVDDNGTQLNMVITMSRTESA